MVIILLLIFTITIMLTAANRENILLPNNLQDGGAEAKREKSSQPTQFTWKPALEHLGSMLS